MRLKVIYRVLLFLLNFLLFIAFYQLVPVTLNLSDYIDINLRQNFFASIVLNYIIYDFLIRLFFGRTLIYHFLGIELKSKERKNRFYGIVMWAIETITLLLPFLNILIPIKDKSLAEIISKQNYNFQDIRLKNRKLVIVSIITLTALFQGASVKEVFETKKINLSYKKYSGDSSSRVINTDSTPTIVYGSNKTIFSYLIESPNNTELTLIEKYKTVNYKDLGFLLKSSPLFFLRYPKLFSYITGEESRDIRFEVSEILDRWDHSNKSSKNKAKGFIHISVPNLNKLTSILGPPSTQIAKLEGNFVRKYKSEDELIISIGKQSLVIYRLRKPSPNLENIWYIDNNENNTEYQTEIERSLDSKNKTGVLNIDFINDLFLLRKRILAKNNNRREIELFNTHIDNNIKRFQVIYNQKSNTITNNLKRMKIE